MKQILQSAKSGELELADVPAPAPCRGQVLVRNLFSVVSPGTEKLMIDFARKSLLTKAQARPDLVRQVLRKVAHDGPLPTYRAVMTRLDEPQPLGYSCAGIVEEVGPEVEGFSPGDRVACAGAGYANHAEFIVVPENLVAHVPEGVEMQDAAFSTIGSIAMQSLRIAQPLLGEIAAVLGLGIIGQLAVQLLKANGCRVLAIDLDQSRVELAKKHGAEWGYVANAIPANWKEMASSGFGADFALITAGSKTSAPIEQAAELCRHKGRIVLVGMMPMELERRSFYEKELDLRMSTSYGPGRYDRRYEECGLDYPLPYVRWTENRNLQSFLSLIAAGSVRPGNLGAEVLEFDQAEQAYARLAEGKQSTLGILFRYSSSPDSTRSFPVATNPTPGKSKDNTRLGFVGAGTYAKGILLPALAKQHKTERAAIITATGASAKRTAEKFSFETCGTDPEIAFSDSNLDLIFIATRHNSHADLAKRGLRSGKAVWLEKPAGLHREEIDDLIDTSIETGSFLTIGYNRRFSSHARRIRKAFIDTEAPVSIHYVIAAGATPTGTWITDPNEGGGRIIGEVCHFVDLCSFLTGSLPASAFARSLSKNLENDDSTLISIGFRDGSTAAIEYLACTSKDIPKERFEVSGGGLTAHCENFRTTKITGQKEYKTFNQDKGQETAISEILQAVQKGEKSPFSLQEIAAVSYTTFAIVESIRTGKNIKIDLG